MLVALSDQQHPPRTRKKRSTTEIVHASSSSGPSFLAIVWVCTQLTGQAVLALGTIALLSYLEIVSCARTLESRKHTQSLTYPTPFTDSPRSAHPPHILQYRPPSLLSLYTMESWVCAYRKCSHVHFRLLLRYFLTGRFIVAGRTKPLAAALTGLTVVLNSVGSVAVWGGLGAGLVGCWQTSRSGHDRRR
jgi:hypothetical protein